MLAFDRRQRGTFRKSFEEYAATRVTAGRIRRGQRDDAAPRRAAVAHRAAVRRAAAMLVAIWGLETDFGSGDMGKLPVVRTLATHGA